ncbi:uncharacterized protein LOC130196316 [Pseudoliparis swirei]|uniref:uncharacterized protein LOC130196316 n=1 Tax=Pseudoliparis swirei TaxID=2059687 RepID=UPI0024BEEAE6|nr:uncharacterized protein LOC130196316 [Pseudoliparis swirei]
MLRRENVHKMPQNSLSAPSASIASGGSLSKYAQRPTSKARTWPVQQGTRSTSTQRSSGSEALLGPRGSYSFTPSSRQTADAGLTGYSTSTKSSRSSSPGAAEPRRIPVRTKTSASAAARRVSSRHGSAASTPSRFSSLQNKSTRNNPGQTGARKPFSSRVGPASGTSGQGVAPSTTHQIPQRFGGYAIRRLRGPADQKEVNDGKPPLHRAYVVSRRPSSLQKPAYVTLRHQSLLQKQPYPTSVSAAGLRGPPALLCIVQAAGPEC